MYNSMMTVGKYSEISNDHSELVKVIGMSEGITAIAFESFSITECLSFILYYRSFHKRIASV